MSTPFVKVVVTFSRDGLLCGCRTEASEGADMTMAELVFFNEYVSRALARHIPTSPKPIPVIKAALREEFGEEWSKIRSITALGPGTRTPTKIPR